MCIIDLFAILDGNPDIWMPVPYWTPPTPFPTPSAEATADSGVES